ncbi:MAG: peptidase C1 [Sphingomonadaceae bacterium]|nr:peptidase C1 [Sphingomonadaceae bacterium]
MTVVTVLNDLRAELGAARNQGPRPTCLAFAASDAHAALRPGWEPLSCEFAFYHAQRRAGRPPDSGATLDAMLTTLRHDGQPAEPGWPYLAATPTDVAVWSPPAEVGPRFGRLGAPQAASVDGVIGEIGAGRPMILLLMLSRSFYAPGADAVIREAAGEAPEPARRHAVVAVGHGTVSGERVILVRNSWGCGWGDAGHGWLTESFIAPRLFAAALLTEDVDVSAGSAAA